jgi:hypothetical protein
MDFGSPSWSFLNDDESIKDMLSLLPCNLSSCDSPLFGILDELHQENPAKQEEAIEAQDEVSCVVTSEGEHVIF